MTKEPRERYAVGAFDGWERVLDALRQLQSRGLDLGSVSLLATKRALECEAKPLSAEATAVVKSVLERAIAFEFPLSDTVVCCTDGLLADHISARFKQGAANLMEALATWLLRRHAEGLERAVRRGRILMWIQLFDVEGERNACEVLLAVGCGTVEVHDFMSHLVAASPSGKPPAPSRWSSRH